jgi:CRP-like cAMP-binding protein
MEGWAARYKVVPDGSRQITAILVPGDFCDLHITILGEMDHGITALTRVKVALVPHLVMENLPVDRPQLGRALWWATLVDEATLRAWIVNLGRRDAAERVAHLFCELHARLKLVGLADEDDFSLPLTQEILADALGLTPVHINRVLQRLRSQDLIELEGGELRILNLPHLRKLAGFDPTYLHRGRLGRIKDRLS